MKTLIVLFLVAIFLTFFNVASGQIRYDLSFDTTSTANMKSVLNLITEGKSTHNRYTYPHHITFESTENIPDAYFYSFNNTHFSITNVTRSEGGYKFVPKAGGTDCGAAELICSNSSFSANSSGAGNQELNSSNSGCLDVENQSSWYYINIQTSGTLEMTIAPSNGNDDYDWAIWGPFTPTNAAANCPPTSSPIKCSYSSCSTPTGMGSGAGCYGCGFLGLFTCYGTRTGTGNSEGAGGDSWVAPLNVNAGEVYILLVDNFSISGDPYSLTWSGSAVLGCTPVPLPVELVDFTVEESVGGNLVEWKTAREVNNDYFLVETSTDNVNWKNISIIDASDVKEIENNEVNVYNTLHTDYSNEVNYYRLTQVDFDGQRETFHIVAVDNSVKEKVLVKIVNSMGQEIRADEPGLQFEIYDDGSCVRRYKQ